MSAMNLVQELLESGRVRVPADLHAPDDLEAAVRVLDEALRPEMPFEAPTLVRECATWALTLLLRACQFFTYRAIDEETVRRELSAPCPRTAAADVCYSVDLSFRFIPDLLALARGIAPGDPLVECLMKLARDWPLSSVGVKDVGDVDVTPFIGHGSLRQLYADRIIERGDVTRVTGDEVRQVLAESIGHFPELAPKIAEALSARAA